MGVSARGPSSAPVQLLSTNAHPNLQHILDNVRGLLEPVDLGHGGLYFARRASIGFILEDCSHGGAQAFCVCFARRHHDACCVRSDARCNSRLVVAQWDTHQRHALGKGLQNGIHSGVRNHHRGSLDDLQLRSESHHQRIAAESAQPSRLKSWR